MNIIISYPKIKKYFNITTPPKSASRYLKKSLFNYEVKNKDNQVIIYNTLYNSLVLLSDSEYRLYNELQNKTLYETDFFSELSKNGFLVPVDTDEKKEYLDWVNHQENKANILKIMLAYSLECNAKCYYCFENRIRSNSVDLNWAKKVISFLKERAHDYEHIAITWYGGEPLLHQDIISNISVSLKQNKLNFSSNIDTNGALLKDIADSKKIKTWNLKSIQLPIDGTEQVHLCTKQFDKNIFFSFDNLYKSIDFFLQNNVYIKIRLNISCKNRESIIEIAKQLSSRFSGEKYLSLYPAFLNGLTPKLTSKEKIIFIKELFNSVNDPSILGMPIRLCSSPRYKSCMYNDQNGFAIDPYCNIYPCASMVGNINLIDCKLNDFSSNVLKHDVLLHNRCDDCVFLPKCLGGCHYNFINGDLPCNNNVFLIKGYLLSLMS